MALSKIDLLETKAYWLSEIHRSRLIDYPEHVSSQGFLMQWKGVKEGVSLCYKKTTKKWRNLPRKLWKVRGSRKYLRGNNILLWKVCRSRTYLVGRESAAEDKSVLFWKLHISRRILAAREIWSWYLIFMVFYKRGEKAQCKGSDFLTNIVMLSIIPSPDLVLRRTCIEDWGWWLPLKNSASESSWCLAKHLWLDLYVNTNSTFHVAKLFLY
jgi:hypothetical protein